MCRHQAVKQYIQNVLTSVTTVLEKAQLEQVVFVILDASHHPLQRFVFELMLPATRVRSSDNLCLLKLEQELRAFILKINTSDAQLTSIPPDNTWVVQVHTSQAAALEMQQHQCVQDFTWIPADDREISMKDRQIIPLKAVSCEVVKVCWKLTDNKQYYSVAEHQYICSSINNEKMQLFVEESGKNE
ncbi:hypothetical protein NP493_448g03028 [Ridgeia piscesae]|uniref:HORMA domain-containing protein n=1 Tax=Ridgeia piscesae TaxID=27915 RepID=A0AAD9KZ05_RIDPI|nr:hypothetical protein NP493_448g03028 [Ridgeia piscesae]